MGKKRDHAPVGLSSEADPETNMRVQVLYLGDDPREDNTEVGK